MLLRVWGWLLLWIFTTFFVILLLKGTLNTKILNPPHMYASQS